MSRTGLRSFAMIGALLATVAGMAAGATGAIPATHDFNRGRGVANRKNGYRGGGSFGSYRPTKWERENLFPSMRTMHERKAMGGKSR